MVSKVTQQPKEGMAKYWDGQFTVTGNGGIPRLLRCDVEFVETGWHYEVDIMKGNMFTSRDHSEGWYTSSSSQVKTREMGHLMGPDTYFLIEKEGINSSILNPTRESRTWTKQGVTS